MIKISTHLFLEPIKTSDDKVLYSLMKEIYPPAYSHFWTDNGDWYVNLNYSKETILKELSNEQAEYYFILFKKEVVGVFRIIWNEKLKGLSVTKQVKLHRIYLHPKTQGKGIGTTLLTWLELKAKEKGYTSIWLDAMDEKPKAFEFYKKLGFKYHSHTFLPFELLHKEVRKMSQVYKII